MVLFELSTAIPSCSSWRTSSIVFVTFRMIEKGTDIDTFSNIFENFYTSVRVRISSYYSWWRKKGRKERKRKKSYPREIASIHRKSSLWKLIALVEDDRCSRILTAVEIHFPPRGSHFFSPFLPLVNPFSLPLLLRFGPLNAAPISLTRIIARKIRNGAAAAMPRGDAIILQIGGYPPLPLLPSSTSFFFFLSFSTSISLVLSPSPSFFIHPRKYGRVKRGSPRPSTSATRVSTSLLLAILSLSLSPMRFLSFSLYLATPSKSSSAFFFFCLHRGGPSVSWYNSIVSARFHGVGEESYGMK